MSHCKTDVASAEHIAAESSFGNSSTVNHTCNARRTNMKGCSVLQA